MIHYVKSIKDEDEGEEWDDTLCEVCNQDDKGEELDDLPYVL